MHKHARPLAALAAVLVLGAGAASCGGQDAAKDHAKALIELRESAEQAARQAPEQMQEAIAEQEQAAAETDRAARDAAADAIERAAKFGGPAAQEAAATARAILEAQGR